MAFTTGAVVRHPRFGRGTVRLDDGASVVVRFDHGVEECLPSDLKLLAGVEERAASGQTDNALNVVTRVLGNCVRSVNDAWGVFSASRIELLPHQLWVCKRVLESWPTRWLVADDVGLGKTIEAGLILTPLIASGRVQRLLILAPASLVEQWQVRLREMFDIRVSTYSHAIDTDREDYWNTQHKVVASAHTLRLDIGGRWDRIVAAKPWDLVIVDEAHHLNFDEDRGRTLSFQLVERLQENGRIRSMLFFTGTPHRGKDHGFLSLLKLLRPADFDTNDSLEAQVTKLRSVMIRNNKQRVTDMRGKPVFTPVTQKRETYSYSPEEAYFYEKLTEFIVEGKTHAAGLDQKQRRTAILVLIAMQKLASSSVAAVRATLANRLARLRQAQRQIHMAAVDFTRLQELLDEDDPANLDEVVRLEENIAAIAGDAVRLNPEEIPALEELIAAADQVKTETKIERIIQVTDASFPDEAVLYFSEYKATQALLMSALQERFGDGCVTFINGDGFVDGVRDSRGKVSRHTEDRRRAADRFNRGEVRFLVSTEAAGEGIDLQENCSRLIHVDLPWNPMRLHQRAGRLSRYGQSRPVTVVTVRNPETVESRIWECLDRKLDRITLAFRGAMDDPEDMRQLVIGMASPRLFTEVFADVDPGIRGERLEQWFDAKTATFGGKDAVESVRALTGNVAHFDFGEVSDQIPRVDLPDLVPFLKALLAVLGKRPQQADSVHLSFKTPDEWLDDFALADRYDLLFARDRRPQEGEDIAGVGLRIVNRAIQTAIELPDSFAVLGGLGAPIVVFALQDTITGAGGAVRRAIVGVQPKGRGTWDLLRDWQVMKLLNGAADRPRSLIFEASAEIPAGPGELVANAEEVLRGQLDGLDLPFQLPMVEKLALLLPGTSKPQAAEQDER